jgi:hypothetical protein
MASTEFVFAERDARELLHALDLDSDTDSDKVVEEIRKRFGELDRLRKSEELSEQEKKFAEQFPAVYEEHNKLMATNRENAAIKFSEGVKTIRKAEGYALKDTRQGLSMEALNSIVEVHKKFAEGTATIDDFEEVVKKIVNGGIVQFGELGSSTGEDDVPDIDTTTAAGVAGARKMFGELVARTQQENPEWDFRKAYSETAKKHPDLAEAYQVSLPG